MTTPARSTPSLVAIALLLSLILVALFALRAPPWVPPKVVPATAEAHVFSAERARLQLYQITRQPSPVGSAEHARVQDYLMAALRELGHEPQLQSATALRRRGASLGAAAVENIVVRIPGSNSTGVIVVMAHYDTVPHSPGGTDAGNAVAAILETVRALGTGPALRNDVVVLITDAEEVGLFGAQAYVDEHPWAPETALVLNHEGRGHTGPVVMFRSTDNNGRMISTLASAAPYPLADSLANDAFRLMPNDTDLSVFDRAGYSGMDFANAHGLTHYHTAMDNYENADPRSLQHHGSYMLSLVRAFGDQDLTELDAPGRVVFALPLVDAAHYPISWVLPLAIVAVLILAGLVICVARSKQLRGRSVALGFVHFAVMLVTLPVLAMFAWGWVATLIPELNWFMHGSPYGSTRYLWAVCLLLVALYLWSLILLRRWTTAVELFLAPLTVGAVLLMATALYLPGGSYLFQWPLLFASLALLLPLGTIRARQWSSAVFMLLAGFPAIAIILPMIEGLEVMLTMEALVGPVVLLVLLAGLLTLPLDNICRALGWKAPVGFAVAGGGLLILLLLTAGFDESRKKPNGVNYLANVTEGQALWYSLDPEPDEWTQRFLGDTPQYGPLPSWGPRLNGRNSWSRPAPMPTLTAPDLEILADSTSGDLRQFRVRITAPAGNYSTLMRFANIDEARVISVDGRLLSEASDWSARPGETRGVSDQLIFNAVPEEGVEVEFSLPADAVGVRVLLHATIPGLPQSDLGEQGSRPEHMVPAGPWMDVTELQRVVELP